MQLSQLQLVKHILETGSLSKTALRLNKAQSVVSRQLAALEDECGGRIFDRNGRGVVPTELGERILPLVDVIIDAAGELTRCGAELRNGLSGEVRVSVGPQIARLLSGPLYRELKLRHPGIRLSVWDAYSGIRADLQEGRTDIAVFMHTFYTPDDEDHQVIGEIDTYLFGLPNSPATREETIPFSQLANFPLLLPSIPNGWRRSIDQLAAREKLTLTVAAEVNAPSATAALVHDGAGYLIAPMVSGPAAGKMGWIGEDLRARRLRASRIVNPGLSSKLMVTRGINRNRSVDEVVRLIVTMLPELMGLKPLCSNAAKARGSGG